MQEFINMGGYGTYVWSSFGLTIVVLVWNAWSAKAQFRTAMVHARRRVAAQPEDS